MKKLLKTFTPALLFLALTVTPIFGNGFSNEEGSRSSTLLSRVECGSGLSLIPGVQQMARGVDITRLDLTTVSEDDGFRGTLIDFTCTRNRTWRVPGVRDVRTGQPYALYWWPDQVEGVNVLSGGSLAASTTISSSIEAFKNHMASTVSGSARLGWFARFSGSASVVRAEESRYQENRMIAETSAFASAIQADLHVQRTLQASLSASFANFFGLNVVNVTRYADARDLYDTFVETFGTHYFSMAHLGGYLHMRATIDRYYYQRTSRSSIESYLEASYLSIARARVDYRAGASSSLSNFYQNSRITFSYLGGESLSMELGSSAHSSSSTAASSYLAEWTKTVFERPHLFGGQLRRIDELIENERLRAEVRKAINAKLYGAYVAQIRRIAKLAGVDVEASLAKLESLYHNSVVNSRSSFASESEEEEREAHYQAALEEKMQVVLAKANSR